MRLINADALMQDIEKYHLSDGKFQHWVEVQPTIEERKTGKWKKVSASRYVTSVRRYAYKCSECGDIYDLYSNFCPNCGADMRGDK